MKKVLIIGGGASGLMAAVSAARAGAVVTVLEHNKQVGKKLLITGNGRCNLTNVNQDSRNYRGGVPGFAKQVLDSFGMHDTLRLFTELGIFTKNRNGYLYPYSDQASAVVEALRMEAEHRKVKLALNTQIKGISCKDSGFEVQTEGWVYRGDALILAAGSCAAPQTGSDGSGYIYAKKLGHCIIKPLPALVQLRSRDKRMEKLAGLRMDAKVILQRDGEIVEREEGEVQFTAYGLSGIPIFQLSRYASRALEDGKKVEIELDLMPVFEEEPFAAFLNTRIALGAYKTIEQLLIGLFPKKMAECLRDTAKLSKGKTAEELTEEERQALIFECKHFRVQISSCNGFEQAQACCGGVDTAQVNPGTMESQLVKGLYFAGEILDIDGTCGGYNLQWAWSSGYLAGLHAAREGMTH
ncbi:MAG: NAD(P)/FAD-dependent oxidoreductase [Lachnospiraceae bacterium]|nr:NAD(P)/FAD-dependent oxidoreductase [Lachnospiraceae bacterium]